ncbi:MAG TPA: BON domain-containing protein [Thermoanaerobaculia bacterium]|nr:BON domain-containing protein [Thermoanaerobaculia bacterium]
MKFFQKEADSAIRTGAMVLGGLGLGAALMYVLDPERGKRRRALVRDKTARAAHKARERLDARSRDLRNRARGAAAEVKSRVRREDVPDSVLEERVRAEIGRVVSTPGAIDVSVIARTATLSGPVLASEVDELVARVRGVRGIEDVENRLAVYETPEEVPALQGGRNRWSPAEAES